MACFHRLHFYSEMSLSTRYSGTVVCRYAVVRFPLAGGADGTGTSSLPYSIGNIRVFAVLGGTGAGRLAILFTVGRVRTIGSRSSSEDT